MEAVIHRTDPGPEHWRWEKARANLLNEPSADVDRVTLIDELDTATLVIDGPESSSSTSELRQKLEGREERTRANLTTDHEESRTFHDEP